jgi:hypothetical protein
VTGGGGEGGGFGSGEGGGFGSGEGGGFGSGEGSSGGSGGSSGGSGGSSGGSGGSSGFGSSGGSSGFGSGGSSGGRSAAQQRVPGTPASTATATVIEPDNDDEEFRVFEPEGAVDRRFLSGVLSGREALGFDVQVEADPNDLDVGPAGQPNDQPAVDAGDLEALGDDNDTIQF